MALSSFLRFLFEPTLGEQGHHIGISGAGIAHPIHFATRPVPENHLGGLVNASGHGVLVYGQFMTMQIESCSANELHSFRDCSTSPAAIHCLKHSIRPLIWASERVFWRRLGWMN